MNIFSVINPISSNIISNEINKIKIPIWVEQIMLEILTIYDLNEISNIIKEYDKYNRNKMLLDIFKLTDTKYNYWIKNGYEINILKESKISK